MKISWLPPWSWLLMRRHFLGRRGRPAVRWMNRFAFLGVLVGVFSWTAVLSIMNGLQSDIQERILKEKPHFLWEGRPTSGLESKAESIRIVLGEELKKIQFVLQTEGLLELTTKAQKGRTMGSGVVLQGVENFGDQLSVGTELMSLISLSVGDPVRLRSVWNLELAPLDLKVSDSLETGVYELDRSVVRMDRGRLETWMGLSGAVSRIEIQLKNPLRASQLLPALVREAGLDFKSWEQTESSLWYSLKLEKIVMSLAIFFVVLIAAFAVHLAISVRVADKVREIGLLRALGANDKYLARMYLSEGALIGLCGSASGLMLSYFFCHWLSGNVRLPQIYYSTKIPVDWSWPDNALLALCAISLTVFASWLPAQRARSVEIQESLRS